MTEKIQYIAREGRAEYAVVPIDEWNRVVALAEDAEDLRAADEAVRELHDGNDETVPLEVVEQLIEGNNAVAIWRNYRGLTQQQLADAAGVTKSHISQIEKGVKTGSLHCMQKIATRLSLNLDDLVQTSDSAED